MLFYLPGFLNKILITDIFGGDVGLFCILYILNCDVLNCDL